MQHVSVVSQTMHGRLLNEYGTFNSHGESAMLPNGYMSPPLPESKTRVPLSLWWEFGRASPPSYAISRVGVCNSSVHAPHTNPQVIISCQLEQVLLKDLICPTGGDGGARALFGLDISLRSEGQRFKRHVGVAWDDGHFFYRAPQRGLSRLGARDQKRLVRRAKARGGKKKGDRSVLYKENTINLSPVSTVCVCVCVCVWKSVRVQCNAGGRG